MMPSQKDFAEVVRKANAGDAAALAELRRLLDENPSIWQQLGDLGAHAESALLTLVAGDDQLTRESIARKLQELRSELSGTSPTTLERLAIDRIAITWLELQHADVLYGTTGRANARQMTTTARWLDQAARRYHLAVRSLLDVRRISSSGTIRRSPVQRSSTPNPDFRVFTGDGSNGLRDATGT